MHDWLLWWQQRGGPASDWLSSVPHEYVGEEDLQVMHQAGNQGTPLSDIHCASFDVWVRDLIGPPQSTCCLASMHLTHGHYAIYWGYRILAMCQMRKSEEPLVVHRFLAWWLIDVCGSSAIWFFGHIARRWPCEDHNRALAVCIWPVPPDWKRPAGRPSHTWLRAIEADLGPLNFGLATAWRKATTRDEWRHIIYRPIYYEIVHKVHNKKKMKKQGKIKTQQRSSGVRSERRNWERFSKVFHITKISISPAICCYTTLWVENPKMSLTLTASQQIVDMFLRTLWGLDLTFNSSYTILLLNRHIMKTELWHYGNCFKI